MKINTTKFLPSERSAVIKKKSVVLGPLKKESERLDVSGNVIDPRTKRVIKPNTQ